MFNPIGFNPIPYIAPLSSPLDSQASEQVNSRSKRSLGQAAPDNSINDNEHGADRGRGRDSGNLDSLGKGYLL